jgi:hypothetical protein
MSNENNLPTLAIRVAVSEQGGAYTAQYEPNNPYLSTPTVLNYTLTTPGWEFGLVQFSTPLSDLETVSPTEFNITDNGGDHGTFSFSVKIVGSDPHRGQPAEIDTDPEVINGPPG